MRRMCGVYGEAAAVPWLVGWSSPFSRQRCWGCSTVGWGRPTTMASRVAAKRLVAWTLAPAMVAPNGPPVASTTMRRFTPVCPTIGRGTAHHVTAHPRVAHHRLGGLPRPVHPLHAIARLDEDGPQTGEQATLAPPLDVPMPRAVSAKRLGEPMPWAAGPQATDDAVADTAPVHAPMPLGLGRIRCVQNPLDEGPYLVWNLPERGRRRFVTLCFAPGNPPLGAEGDRSIRSFD
jgi:hypothetical protein